MNKNIKQLDSTNFDEFVKEDKTVVDFWAAWCGPCRIMAPIFEDVASVMKDKAKFGKVDVDENTYLAQRFQIVSIPTTIFFRDGKQISRVSGLMNREDLIKKLKEIK